MIQQIEYTYSVRVAALQALMSTLQGELAAQAAVVVRLLSYQTQV
jgi:hypothetical protein